MSEMICNNLQNANGLPDKVHKSKTKSKKQDNVKCPD